MIETKRKKLANNHDDKSFPAELILEYLIQIVCGVLFLHQRNIAHRDIKPRYFLKSKCFLENSLIIFYILKRNVFITESNQIKIGDYSHSRECTTDSLTATKSGTKEYMCPEILRDESYKKEKSECW
jgi:serine/threonine protein kinase